MNADILMTRAIGCEFLARKLKSLAVLIGITLAVVLVLAVWLTTFSVWWWLLAAPVIILSVLAFVVFVVAGLVLKIFRPNLSEIQAESVKNFVDKFERVTETIQTPWPIIAFYVIRDAIRPRKPSYLQSVTKDSTTLHKDLETLRQKF